MPKEAHDTNTIVSPCSSVLLRQEHKKRYLTQQNNQSMLSDHFLILTIGMQPRVLQVVQQRSIAPPLALAAVAHIARPGDITRRPWVSPSILPGESCRYSPCPQREQDRQKKEYQYTSLPPPICHWEDVSPPIARLLGLASHAYSTPERESAGDAPVLHP